MDDLIYRQAAIDALHEWERVYTWDETCLEDREKVYAPSEVIEDLPDVEPERKPGRWIDACDTKGVEYYRCTECGTYIEKIFFGFDYDVNFCPSCGFPMERGV